MVAWYQGQIASDQMTWSPTVEERVHPFGEQGVRSSLEETAKAAVKALQGEHLVKVRTWAGDKLDDARKRGENVATPEGRAKALLYAVQQKLWVPDPIGIEYIPAGHMMACDDHGPNGEVCVKAEDCDGVVGLLAACYMAVGLYCMIAGHAYDQAKTIAHVLVRVYFNGKWHYADPSALPKDFNFRGRPLKAGDHFNFGECAPYTRERCYSIPEIRVICDGDTCRRNFDPANEGFVKKGSFVGLSGVEQLVVEEMPPMFRWLDEVKEATVLAAASQPFGWLGQTQATEATAQATTQRVSNIEKLMFAGVFISGVSLATHIWELRQKKKLEQQR